MSGASRERISNDKIAMARAVDMVELARRYLKLERHGREWKACCPFHKEKTPSFKVEHTRPYYHCFGCGAHGDAIDFVSKLERLSFSEAVDRLTGDPGRSPIVRVVARTEEPLDINTDKRVRLARALWSSSSRVSDTPIESRYFPARSLPVPAPVSVRFMPEYRWRGDPSMLLPAQIVAVQAPEGCITAIEATALTLRCDRKAFPDSRDKVGVMGAGAARFAAATNVLGVAEGAETAIAAMHLLGIPTWASLGAARLDRIAIPDSVTELVILGDNDPAGRDAASRAVKKYARHGRQVSAKFPPEQFNDWNDLLMAGSRASAA